MVLMQAGYSRQTVMPTFGDLSVDGCPTPLGDQNHYLTSLNVSNTVINVWQRSTL